LALLKKDLILGRHILNRYQERANPEVSFRRSPE
jgi:hypothetical protein